MSSCVADELDVIIVGAGISGLVCASTLVQRCLKVAVLDARSRVGGRLLSTPGGADLGGSWSWPDHDHRLAALARRLGIDAVPQRLDGQAIVCEPGRPAARVGEVGDQLAMCGPDAIRWRGGYARFAEVLAAALPEGTLRLNSNVVCCEAAEGLVRVTVAPAESEGEPQVHSARRVVLALPPRVAVAQIQYSPALPSKQAAQMAATPTWAGDWAKVCATFRTPFWRGRGESGVAATPGLSVAAAWWEGGGGAELGEETSALCGVAFGAECEWLERQGHQADGSSPPAVRAAVEADLSALYGADVAEQLLAVSHKCWRTDPMTNAEGPGGRERGDPRRLYGHPLLSRAQPWGLHFAGTETEAEAGHVEGAVLAGERAAREVVEALS